jgi:3-methyladenine DNA glycosylase AlkD
VGVPEQRRIAKQFSELSLSDVAKLLQSKLHEERLTSLLILVQKFKSGDQLQRKKVVATYLKHTCNVDNWDLVDSSAPYILGEWLLDKDRKVLFKLVKSRHLWERRIAIIASYAFIRNNDARDTLALAEMLLDDEHDLIHKAVGWMLREVGKRVDRDLLRDFLREHGARMPRTALRYAIEHFSKPERLQWMSVSASTTRPGSFPGHSSERSETSGPGPNGGTNRRVRGRRDA